MSASATPTSQIYLYYARLHCSDVSFHAAENKLIVFCIQRHHDAWRIVALLEL